MGLFSKFTPQEPQEGKYGEKSGVAETISAGDWDRLRDSLPFASGVGEWTGSETKELIRGVKFGHQRFGKPHLS